ncbi:hypothetical protein KIW84_056451 [Lathyrus oleraceus]|uniref:Uncharacterized protein n=1 Tax=Pisum sativum TaxID=3888 RepID=A0A9D4WYF3_PEA|nr:hypothetical protein KIW84_056451 [Pisum sativum]
MNAIKLESTKPHLTNEEDSGMNGTKLESIELGKEMKKSTIVDQVILNKNFVKDEVVSLPKGVVAVLKNQILRLLKENLILKMKSIVLDHWSGKKNIFTEFLEISKGADKSTIADQVIPNKNFMEDEVVSLRKGIVVDLKNQILHMKKENQILKMKVVVAVLKNQILRLPKENLVLKIKVVVANLKNQILWLQKENQKLKMKNDELEALPQKNHWIE